MNLIVETQKLQNYLKAKDFKTVVYGCEKLITKFPNNAFLFNLLGLALHGNGNYLIAIDKFKRALDLDPNFLPAKNNLANSYKAIGNFEKAEFYYKNVLKIKPNYIQALNNYANLKALIFDYYPAIELYNEALKIKENDETILFTLANAYHAIGETDKTKEIAEKILKLHPKHVSAHKLLSSIVDYSKDQANLDQMEDIILEKDLSNPQIVDLSFALGKAYEDLKKFEKSFFYLEKANKIKKNDANYNINEERNFFETIKNTFQNFNFKNEKKIFSKIKPIYICGMPRSGTTLVEQIIASHNEVRGAGELDYLSRSIKENIFENNTLSKSRIEEEIFLESSKIADDYNKLLGFHKFEEGIITDKAPHNFKWLGVIKLFFKDAKIIHCTRNPKDICLSIFKNFFSSPEMEWSSSQTDIANFYNLYKQTMEFWNKILGNSIYNIKYESLINDQEKEVRSLLKFCDLDFDPQCLNHHKSKKTPIRTVSVNQARKPIYSSSINKNQFYEKNLNEMFSLLDN